jgi:hypothetical protein
MLVAMKICATVMENNMEVPQKPRDLPYDPVIPFLDIYLKEYQQDIIEPLAHSCLLQHYL